MNKTLMTFLRVMFSILLLVYVVYISGYNNIVESFSKINPWIYPLLFVLMIAYLFFGGINIALLGKGVKENISLWKAIKYYAISFSLGMFVPGKLGDFSLIYFLKKDNIRTEKGFLISVLIKLFSVLVLGTVAIFGFRLFFSWKESLIYSGLTILLVLIVLIILLSANINHLLQKLVKKYAKNISYVRKMAKDFFRNNISRSGLIIMFTLARFSVDAFITYLLLLFLNVHIGFFYILIINSIVAILAMIPISISGLGIREGLKIYLLGILGVSAGVAGAVALIYIVFIYLVAIFTIATYRVSDNYK